MPTNREKLILLYRQMADITLPECKYSCRVPLSCCSPEYCDMARSIAKEQWGIELEETGHPTLPFMSATGCTVDPHLRPNCTLHTCDINGLGFKRGDQKWTDRYFKLRAKIEKLEFKIFGG